ncbi:nuclear envelope integral membrane protein 2 [Clarias gariepinus]|uniref:nuclear envelope integral membrane protein 2 n=1 Tax=Clarias gariepinus TaxID=13013 RepID=UPI00234CAF72|nr:nuclear envelope integral membrane protein 2 [Clarias gariepinus]
MNEVVSSLCAVGLVIIFISHAEGNSGYSYADCTYVKPDHPSTYYGERCFCYTSPTIKWKDFWSTFQVHASSSQDVVITYPMKPRACQDPENLLKLASCLTEHYWPSRVQKEKDVDIPLVEEEVCFMIRSPRASSEYTLHVSKHRFNKMRFFLFVSGLALFFFAEDVCRSSLFFYISGVSLGTVSIFVFLLLVLKNFIPTRGLFLLLFGAGAGLSYLGIQKLMTEWEEVMRLYWKELLGYLLVSGCVSLAVCHRLGPVIGTRALNVMTLVLRVMGAVVACHGVTYAPVSWILLVVMLGVEILPLLFTLVLELWRQVWWLLSAFLGLFHRRRSSNSRLLTEDEYREQAERHTRASLEELRRYCTNPGFPAWDTVLRLRAPQRFAEFLRNGAHVTESELQSHTRHHSAGAEYTERELLNSTHTTATSEDFSDDEVDNSTHRSPNSSPFSAPPAVPALPAPPALPTAPAYTPTICPYPPMPYIPVPERPLTDDDEPF